MHPALFFFNQTLSLSLSLSLSRCNLILRVLFALFFDLSVSGTHALKSSQISLSFPSLFNFYYYTFQFEFYFLSRKAKTKNHEFKLREIQLRLRSRNQIFLTQIPKRTEKPFLFLLFLLYLFVFLHLTTQTRVAAQQALQNHQPAPTQPTTRPGISSGPTSSMVGDIFGKTWSSSSASGSSLGQLGPLWV